jgi:hypothetical protein
MNYEQESLLHHVTPRAAPAELRERVLNAVAWELSVPVVPREARWDSRVGGWVAAAVVLAFALNWWAIRSTERRLADLAGPRPVPSQVSDIVEIVESVTGDGAREWIQPRLMQAWRSSHTRGDRSIPNLSQLMNDLEINQNLPGAGKVPTREENQKIPLKNGDRAVFDRRSPFNYECNIAVDSRSPAGKENRGDPGSGRSGFLFATRPGSGAS